MRFPATVLFTAIATAGALSAQTTAVFPSDHDLGGGNRLEGYSYQSSFPFSAGISRQMALYESHDLNIPNGAMITHIGFPRDGNLTSLGHSVRMQIFMGGTTANVKSVDAVFENNYSGPKVEVYATKNFTLPNLGYVTPPPLVDEVWVPLDTPYRFDVSENLLVEYRIHANSNANLAFPYYLDFANFLSPISVHGQGCPTSSGKVPELTSNPTAIGQSWQLTLRDAPGSTTTGLNIGIGLLANPITIPGTNSLCDVVLGALASVGGTTGTTGYLTWTFPVPDDINLNDFSLFSQAFMVDFFANPAGVVVSNGDQIQLGMRPQMAVVKAVGDASAQRGSVQKNWGAMSLFRHQ